MAIYLARIFSVLVFFGLFFVSQDTYAQLPGMNKDEALVPMSSSQITRTFQSREFEGAFPGVILGKRDHHFDRKFSSNGLITHSEKNIETTGKWSVTEDKLCMSFDDYFENQCFRVYEMGNCFYFYEETNNDSYITGREYDRWNTRLVPKHEDGLCRVFIFKKVAGQAPILISPLY